MHYFPKIFSYFLCFYAAFPKGKNEFWPDGGTILSTVKPEIQERDRFSIEAKPDFSKLQTVINVVRGENNKHLLEIKEKDLKIVKSEKDVKFIIFEKQDKRKNNKG